MTVGSNPGGVKGGECDSDRVHTKVLTVTGGADPGEVKWYRRGGIATLPVSEYERPVTCAV